MSLLPVLRMRLSILVAFAVASAVSATSYNTTCLVEPRVRKEWRDISDEERLKFINAVKVCISFTEAALVV